MGKIVRYLLTASIVLIGLAGIFGIPQKWGLTDTQVILGLLLFILGDLVFTNVVYLDDISSRLKAVERTGSSVDSFFVLRNQKRRPTATVLQQAKFFRVSGISLDSFFIAHRTGISAAAKRGAKLQFLLASPKALFLSEIALKTANYTDRAVYETHIVQFLKALQQMDASERKHIEVRLTQSVIYASVVQYSFISPNNAEYMAADFYAFGTGDSGVRSLELERATSPEMFDYICQSEERRWDKALVIDLAQSIDQQLAQPGI